MVGIIKKSNTAWWAHCPIAVSILSYLKRKKLSTEKKALFKVLNVNLWTMLNARRASSERKKIREFYYWIYLTKLLPPNKKVSNDNHFVQHLNRIIWYIAGKLQALYDPRIKHGHCRGCGWSMFESINLSWIANSGCIKAWFITVLDFSFTGSWSLKPLGYKWHCVLSYILNLTILNFITFNKRKIQNGRFPQIALATNNNVILTYYKAV